MSRPTLAQERTMLAEIRELADRDGALALLAHLGGLSPHDELEPGQVAQVDQVMAATDETEKLLHKNGDACGWHHRSRVPVDAGLPLLAAGTLRCLVHSRCEHACAGSVPLYVFLYARVIACQRCLPRYRGALVAAARNGAGDRTCDFCLTDNESNQFTGLGITFGPSQVYGDACSTCSAELRGEAVAS